MRSFAQRSGESEWMEAPDVTAGDLADCLADLAVVNTVTRARAPTLAWLAGAARDLSKGAGFTLLDVGFGEGDMLRAIAARAARAGLRARLIGVDLSPWSAPAAEAATDPALGIDYRVGDVFDFDPAEPVDFIISCQVTHHMTDDQIIRFLAWMEARARRGWFVNDLQRHPFAYYGFRALSTAAGWHRFVRHDGPVSVARSFVRADWERLIAAAGLPESEVTIAGRAPFRLCVGRLK